MEESTRSSKDSSRAISRGATMIGPELPSASASGLVEVQDTWNSDSGSSSAVSRDTMAPHSDIALKEGSGGGELRPPASCSTVKSESFSFSNVAKYQQEGFGLGLRKVSHSVNKIQDLRIAESGLLSAKQSINSGPRRVINLFALTRKNDTRARRASGVADLLLQQPLAAFEMPADSSRRGSRTVAPNLEMFPSAQPSPMDDPLTVTHRSDGGGGSTLPSDTLPRPSIMDLAFCDLQKVQQSFMEHTSVWNQGELLDRFKRLVIRAIKEEEDQVIAEEEAAITAAGGTTNAAVIRGERDPVYETALSTGFLNGPDIIPVGVPARFLQKARAQLMWEYERRVASRMEQMQCTKYQNLRYAQQQEEFCRSVRFGRPNPLGVQTKDGYLSHAMPRGNRAGPHKKGDAAAVRCGGDTMPMPIYLTRSISENRALLASEILTAPPSYKFPWDIDVYDGLSLVLAAERRMKDAAEFAASLDKAKEEAAVNAQEEGNGTNDPSPPPVLDRKKPNKKGSGDGKHDIPLPTFVYVVSRILFRMNYFPAFPTGLFNRELIDPYYFPEPEELDAAYFFRYYPGFAAAAEKIYEDRLERLEDQFVGVQPPIEASDFISVHQLLCPPKKKDNSFNDVALPWLYLTEEQENDLMPAYFTEAMRVDRHRYREMLQATAQKENLLAETSRMMTICRLVAFEFFESIDSTQRGVISWSEFTDALIEHAEVAHHREKAEESMKVMRTCASVFDHYKVENLPSVLLQLGYCAFTVEVKYSGALVILKGPYDFAVCNGPSGGSVELKFTVRSTKDILEDHAKAVILAERAAANGDTAGIEFHNAEASSRPWRNNTKVPGVFIRYIDGKRLDEVAAMSIASQVQKDRKEELARERKEQERLAKELEASQGAPATSHGADWDDEKGKEKSATKLPKVHAEKRNQDSVSVRKKDDIETIAAIQLNDVMFGLPPMLLVLCSDLILRLYVMVSMLVAMPETAILRTYETVTCIDWCGASAAIHEELRHYIICGTRGGNILIMNLKAALKNMPRLNEARHGVIGSVFNSNAGYADLAGITHQDDIYHYITFDKCLHKSVVSSVDVSDSGVVVSSSLDGEVCMGRLYYTVRSLEITPMRRFHACDSGVRAALYANIAQVIVVQTVASKIFVYGVANQKVHVELYDPQAPHFFPIISMIVVDDLDQLITADTSGFVKVWSLRRCTPLSAFYALSRAGRVNMADGVEAARLFDVDQQGGGSAAPGGGGSTEAKRGLLATNRRTIEKSLDTALSLAPLRNLSYDHVSHRLFATGLRNSVMCTFVFGQGGARAHVERISFIGISFRHQWLLTMSCSDCRLWTLNTGTMSLGIRANNAEYNLLASERLSHLDKSSGHSDGAGLMSNLNDFLEDTHHSMDAIKRMPRSSVDVIRTVAATKVKVNAYKRVPLHIPKSEVPHVRLEMQMSRFSEDPLGGIGGGRATTGAADVSNENDNTRNTNVKHGDILCAVIGQHDRLLIYALSTGDIRVHRSDSGRLVKTYVTLPPTTEEVISAALFYRHLFISSNMRGKQDDFSTAVAQEVSQGVGQTVAGSIMTQNSILKSLTSQQRVEAVAALLQRMLSDTKDAVMMGGASRGSFHVEPVNMICLDSSQELVVMYADGVVRYFPLIGTMLTSHKLIIPEFLIVKAVHFFNSPPPTKRRPITLVASIPPANPFLATPVLNLGIFPAISEVISVEDSTEEVPVVRTTGNSGRRSISNGRSRQSLPHIQMRLPRNLNRSQTAAKESLEALNHAIVEADAVSLVAVSTYLQLFCIVQVTGVVSVIDISGGGTSAAAVATADMMSVPVGANVVHSFVTKEEVTSIAFMGAYPCLMVADRFSELHFYLLKGSSTLSLVDDFFKAIVIDRHSRFARSMRDSMGMSVRESRFGGSTSHAGMQQSKCNPQTPVSNTKADVQNPSTDKKNAMLPRVWSVRMPPEIGTPLSIHFDPRYSTVYVGTKDGYISSFNVQKFILAADLSPLCISAAEVSLDTYLMALKQQQQESNEEVIRNFLLIVFGLTPSDIKQYLLHLQKEKMKEYLRVRELSKANSHIQISLPPMPDTETPKWENSLQWVYENCETLLRGAHTFVSDDPEREPLKPLIDLDEVNLTDLLLATTIMHDATRLISLRQQVGRYPAKQGSSVLSSASGSGAFSVGKSLIDPSDPALTFLRMRENNPDDADDDGPQMCKSVVLKRCDIHQIRRWIQQALNNRAEPPLVDCTKPWNCGWRTYRRTSSTSKRQNSASSDTLRGQKKHQVPDTAECSTYLLGHHDSDEEDHLIVSRWVEPLFQRHAMFMSDNCPLTLLSPFATLERARREKQEREKAMLQSTQIHPATLEQAASEAEADTSAQHLRKGNWDEFVEGIIPRVQPTSSKQGGVLQEMERLLAADMGVIRILTRRNGYVFVGLEDGSVSLWTPFTSARVAQVCSSVTLPASVVHLGEAVKNQFAQLYEIITLQRQRVAFEADGMLGRNAVEGESKIKAKIKSMLVNHQLQTIKKETAKEEAARAEAEADGTLSSTERKEVMRNSDGPSVHPATVLMEQHLEEVRDIMQLHCGYQNKEEFASKHLYLEDLFYLPMHMADLMEIESLEPSWYQNAVDLSVDRLLFDVAGAEIGTSASRKDYHRHSIYHGLTSMSTATLVAKGDIRLVVAMLNYVLEEPVTHEVDFINFAHDHLLSVTTKEEASELREIQRLKQKMQELRQQERQTSSWTRRLRGGPSANASESPPFGKGEPSHFTSIMESVPYSSHSRVSLSFNEGGSAVEVLSIEDQVRLRCLQLRVGAAEQLGEEQSSPKNKDPSHQTSGGAVHGARRRSMIRRSLVAVDPIPHGDGPNGNAPPLHRCGEGTLHKMAVERCLQQSPSVGANDVSSRAALEKKIAALGPNRPQTSAAYERAFATTSPEPHHSSGSSSTDSDETEEDPLKMSPARAEAWLYSSTYSHNQPLLLVSAGEEDDVRTSSCSIMDAGKTQELNLEVSSVSDLGAMTDPSKESPFSFPSTQTAFDRTLDSPIHTPRHNSSCVPPTSSLKKKLEDLGPAVAANNGTVAFIAPAVFLTETGVSSEDVAAPHPLKPMGNASVTTPSSSQGRNSSTKPQSLSILHGPASPAAHPPSGLLRSGTDVGAGNPNRLPPMRWSLHHKKKKAKLMRTGYPIQRPRTGPVMPPPTSNSFVPQFAQTIPTMVGEDQRPFTSAERVVPVHKPGTAPRGVSGRLGGGGSANNSNSNLLVGLTDRGAPQRDNKRKKKSLADVLIEAAEEKHAQAEESLRAEPVPDEEPITDVRSFLSRGAHPNPHPHHTPPLASHTISFIRKKCIAEVLPGPQHTA